MDIKEIKKQFNDNHYEGLCEEVMGWLKLNECSPKDIVELSIGRMMCGGECVSIKTNKKEFLYPIDDNLFLEKLKREREAR